MTIENYNHTIKLSISADQVFKALTSEIPFWWTTLFEGSSNSKNDRFTVRFGDQIYKRIRVEDLRENAKVVWSVEDSLIAVPGLKNQQEWIGTTIIWNIIEMENGTVLQLEHIGLHPEIECYAICTDGWRQFVKSLELYVETGKGHPFLN
ncbi:SRPBCC family protein [Sphingobacterium sp.]|uniref:SRPBCC family protein n=1 Tax=Sphingobacterium sp. TaxID=341027 RepID=UPI002FDEC8C1